MEEIKNPEQFLGINQFIKEGYAIIDKLKKYADPYFGTYPPYEKDMIVYLFDDIYKEFDKWRNEIWNFLENENFFYDYPIICETYNNIPKFNEYIFKKNNQHSAFTSEITWVSNVWSETTKIINCLREIKQNIENKNATKHKHEPYPKNILKKNVKINTVIETLSDYSKKGRKTLSTILRDYEEKTKTGIFDEEKNIPQYKQEEKKWHDDTVKKLDKIFDSPVVNKFRYFKLTEQEIEVFCKDSNVNIIRSYILGRIKILDNLYFSFKTQENLIDTKTDTIFKSTGLNNLKDTIYTVKLKDGTLELKENGLVSLNKISSTITPLSIEFKILKTLMNNKDYVATYEELLNKNKNNTSNNVVVSGANIRNLSFVIRNIKKTLGILPKKTAKNKDCIKNIKEYGYRLIT